MKFVAQVVLDASTILSIFLCQNDPGLCDERDPVSGGSRALLFRRGDLVPALVPDGDETQLAEVCGIEVKPVDADGYDEARGKWSAETGRPEAEILGIVGGAPARCGSAPRTSGLKSAGIETCTPGHSPPTCSQAVAEKSLPRPISISVKVTPSGSWSRSPGMSRYSWLDTTSTTCAPGVSASAARACMPSAARMEMGRLFNVVRVV
ncbi:hypothetical protein ACFVYA_12900 [Amycolatopsis sp. NPDC058278]|uniref:hypothetical protein n=1 Tax=Amycolatopsis sp. NPDC058278 TaxID=3346417 RepID=UPI0036DF636F